MNLKKEVIIATLLATMLGAGLGFASYSFVAEKELRPPTRTLDLHTQHGGLGVNESGGFFELNETVQLFAYLAADGLPVNQTVVNFTVTNPAKGEFAESALTDDFGIAETNFTIILDESVVGNWSVRAVASVENESLSDSLILEVKTKSVVTKKVLDLYTQRSGLGANESGGVFDPQEMVQLIAFLAVDGLPVNMTEVTFTVENPSNIKAAEESTMTDNLGIARVNFVIPVDGPVTGNWSVSAIANVENETVSDCLLFDCRITPVACALITTEKNGELCASFEPEDYVTVNVHLYGILDPFATTDLKIEVLYSNGSYFMVEQVTTDDHGDASITFQIPWPANGITGYWHVYVSFEVYGRQFEASARFEVELPPLSIDVYTQQGGQGQNVPGGSFMLNDTVCLYAEISDPLNQTVAEKSVGFTVEKLDGMKFLGVVVAANASGIATFMFHIPVDPDLVGTLLVIVRIEFNDTLLIDTLTFTAEPLG